MDVCGLDVSGTHTPTHRTRPLTSGVMSHPEKMGSDNRQSLGGFTTHRGDQFYPEVSPSVTLSVLGVTVGCGINKHLNRITSVYYDSVKIPVVYLINM